MSTKTRKIDLSKARLDPPSVFDSPEELVVEKSLSKAQKADLLKRWKYDAQRVLDSGSEGFGPKKDGDLLRRIAVALETLEKDG